VADPSAFGFLGPPTGQIDVLAGTVDETTAPVTVNVLQVPVGKTLSFVGGTVNIGGDVDLDSDATPDASGPGYILAPGGHVNLISVASAGDATFDPAAINGSMAGPVTGDPGTRDINVSGFGQLGDINITQGSVVDAKEVSIRGGQLVIDTAAVYPGGFWLSQNLGALVVNGLAGPLPLPDGGLVNINIAGDVSIRGDTLVPVINDLSGILTFAGFPFAAVPGDVADILVNADSLTLSGEKAEIQTVRFGFGNPADVDITADTVEIRNGASITLVNYFQGPGGSLTVNTGDLVIDGSGSTDFTGLSAQGLFHPGYLLFTADPITYFADAGIITVNADNNVTLVNGAFINANSFAFGSGGGVTVNTNNLSLDNGALITAESTLGGPAGNVEINASGQVSLTNISQISSTTSGSGTGGNVVVNGGQSTTVSGSSGIFSSTVEPSQELLDFFASNFAPLFGGVVPDYAMLQSFITSVSGIPDPSIFEVLGVMRTIGLLNIPDSALVPGDGGAVSMTTPLLTINDAAVSSSTGWDGNAGAVAGDVGSLVVENGGEIRSRTGLSDSVGTGNAGNVNFTAANNITVSGGSISTSTIGSGGGGNIELTAGNNIEISNGGSVTSESTSTDDDAGAAGTITISADNEINLKDGAISTRTVNAAGGSVTLLAPYWVYLLDSAITTSVEGGDENSGNILIDPEFVILNNSNILANAYGGNGGNIDIFADYVIISADSSIDASSKLGIDGTINISNPDQDIAKELAVLPENYLDVTGLISDRCGTSAGSSSLVSAGPGGLAVDPDGYLPSFGAAGNVGYNGNGESSGLNSGVSWLALATDLSALQFARVNCTY
jgi:hypothetical protein